MLSSGVVLRGPLRVASYWYDEESSEMRLDVLELDVL
jgi:hypothetical protein